MNATKLLHNLGQSLWLDNITRDLLNSGTLKRYIDELSVTGLTSNPTIFDHAVKNSSAYDAAIREGQAKSGELLFFDLALEDIRRAADLFRPIYDQTDGVDGWVSLEVSPVLAYDTASTLAAAKELRARAGRPNVFIKIPGTKEGLPAIEEAIFAGIPINVTLLFSREQYLAAAEAFMRGIERRIAAGLNPNVGSVASLFVSRWDGAAAGKVPPVLNNQLGIAMANRTYKAYRELLNSARWQRAFNAGARPQRLLWASTGTKDPKASDVLYIKALAAPFTVNTMPEATLLAFADHGDLGSIMSPDGGDCEIVLARFSEAGIKLDALAAQLQVEGAKAFVKSWNELLAVIAAKSSALKGVAVTLKNEVSSNQKLFHDGSTKQPHPALPEIEKDVMNALGFNEQQLEKMKSQPGFVAALDQSGGSTPKALAAYGIKGGSCSDDEEMFAIVHRMRSRIITSPSFDGGRILGAILFENTMDRSIHGRPTADYLWTVKGIVPFLKVDNGLAEEKDGVCLMKPMPQLQMLLRKAKAKGIFGTKMRSVINKVNLAGIKNIVDQQFELAAQILAAGLVPIVEPEVDIHCPEKARAEAFLKIFILEKLDSLPPRQQVLLKLTLPEQDDLYADCVRHPKVVRVLALSGGYSRDEANARLRRNQGVVASFSRALVEGLTARQSDAEFNGLLDGAVQSISEASTVKQGPRKRTAAERKVVSAAV